MINVIIPVHTRTYSFFRCQLLCYFLSKPCPALPADPLHYPFGGGRLELIQRLPATPGLAGGEAIGPDLRPFSLSPAVPDPSLGDQLPSSEPSSVAGRAPMFYF